MRRRIGHIAVAHGLNRGYAEAGMRDPRGLHQALSALTGQDVRKYGELRTTRRSEKPSETEYLKRIYEYPGRTLQSKPYESKEWRTPEHTRQERMNYCQRMRDWRNAQETVNWLCTQLGSFEPGSAESPPMTA
jgi:hypothetical protein